MFRWLWNRFIVGRRQNNDTDDADFYEFSERKISLALSGRTAGQQELAEECSNRKLSPVKSTRGILLELDDVLERIKNDGFWKQYKKNNGGSKHLLFLYGKDYMRYGACKSERVTQIRRLINPKDVLYHQLATIINIDGDNEIRHDEMAFRNFWRKMLDAKGYLGDQSSTTMSVFQGGQIDIVHRIERGNNCFVQGPAVVQCYLIQRNSTTFKGMMDISKYIRQSFDSYDLERYLTEGRGGDSVEIFLQILQDDGTTGLRSKGIKADLATKFPERPKIWQNLEKYGPALVSHFLLEERFHKRHKLSNDSDLPHFSGSIVKYDPPKGHGMALVGMRHDGEQWNLLLQNWWETLQFVEVTAEYLVSSEAVLTWATEPQTDFASDDFPTTYAKYAETHVDGRDYHIPRLDGA